jgi:5-methylcytosine-specific restriction endonuclease McrA
MTRPTPRPNLRQRFDVLAASGFRCDYCGASARTDKKRLQVDHVMPQAKGGTHDLPNLVAACQDCNLGKSDRPLPVPRFTRLTTKDRWDACECAAPSLIASTEEPVLYCTACRFPAYRRVFGSVAA